MKKELLLYGACGGLVVAALRLVEYRLLVVGHAAALYAALVAVLFSAVGIWLGRSSAAPRQVVPLPDAPAPAGPFETNRSKVAELGVTPRELEILGLIATGLSTREIASTLFVSENTVKTHSSRLFGKLGARRRTEAVHLGKTLGLIP